MKLSRAIGVTVVLSTAVASFSLTTAGAQPKWRPLSAPTVGEFVSQNGVSAAKRLNPELSTTDIEELSQDSTARITADGFIVYVEPRRVAPILNAAEGIPASVTSIPLDDFDNLNSRPDASRTIFLDFDGHIVPPGTYWEDPTPGAPVVAGVYPAFTIDGNSAFNDAEKQIIIDAWAAVAEDYAPFNVNVTTEDPGPDAIDRADSSDLIFGTRSLITAGNVSWNPDTCECGGIAFVDVFDVTEDVDGYAHALLQPSFSFASGPNVTGKFISDIVSHEVGHNLGLNHDGSFGDADGDGLFVDVDEDGLDDVTGEEWVEYFFGANDGSNWAPIMGAGYVNGLVQWSDGDYGTSANPATNEEDDLQTIALSGAPFISDETNNSTSTSLLISSTPRDGVIGRPTDVDWFKVVISNSRLGVHSFPPTVDSNLDTRLTLVDSKGKNIFSTDAPSRMTDNFDPVSGLDGILNVDLPNGTYYIRLEGVGRTGHYSDYGSLGSYSIRTRTPTVSSIPARGTPTISGTRRVGRTLTANSGTWTTGTAIARQWLRDGTAISGATSQTYRLTSADVGKRISVRLIGSKDGYRHAVRVSSATTRITR